jgi:hypothetical protein
MKTSQINTIIVNLVLLIALAAGKPFLYVKNNKIYDQNGGERIFHGVNVV